MSQLIHVSGPDAGRSATIIFVHGIAGHAYDTFRDKLTVDVNEDETYWPRWLADAFPGANVSTFSYEAPRLTWFGTAMPILERAKNLLKTLSLNLAGGDGPIIFVCHSLGGLIVKELMLELQAQGEAEATALFMRIMGVVFIATPHLGSHQAGWLDRFRLWTWPSPATLGLLNDDPLLSKINTGYQRLA